MIYTHVLNKGGRGVTSPLDSPRLQQCAGLGIRDTLRPAAAYQDSPSRARMNAPRDR
jgi:hypothetical protein